MSVPVYKGTKKENVWRTKTLTALNDLVHRPVWEDLFYTLYWALHCLLGPLYAISLLVLLARDAMVGMLVPQLEDARGRAVLITGCDSGFGHELALNLYELGWTVYAGCLREESVRTLLEKADGAGMRAVQMDVTKEQDVDRVVKQIAAENPNGLSVLVNNAGVGTGGLVDWMSMAEYRAIMEVNFFAVVGMVKACLPLLKQSKGRIVNVTSMAGLFLGAPCMSAYCASKHASEAFTTSLRMEMKGWGIRVVTVNPSFHNTLIASNGATTLQRCYDALDEEKQAEYGLPYLRACRSICNRAHKSSWTPDNVITALITATTAANPRIQYVVGGDAKYGLLPLLHLPTRVAEGIIEYVLLSQLIPAKVRQATQDQKKEQPQEMALPAVVEPDVKKKQHNSSSSSSSSSKTTCTSTSASMPGFSFSSSSSMKDEAALMSSSAAPLPPRAWG